MNYSTPNHYFILGILLIFLPVWSTGQEDHDVQWVNAAKDDRVVFYGQGWPHELLESPYHRLPSKAEGKVREAVWGLSQHTAGVYLSFATNAKEIRIRYQTNNRYEMHHMPATGVSGLDLYVRNPDDQTLLWCRGKYAFRDTITYTFDNLNTRNPNPGKMYEYNLYLPLYNTVKWMEIGIPQTSEMGRSSVDQQKPILVYGTSIAQGGCASRPAMGWTTIVQRGLDRPVINLAFSGNGRLEEEVIDLINEVEAGLFIMDCLPNLTNEELYPDAELRHRITKSVQTLRETHPETPILLASHAGYSDDLVSAGAFDRVDRVNKVLEQTFRTLLQSGVKNLHYLPKDEIQMCMDCTVDGTHQTDLGMQYYANAYLRKIRSILGNE